MTDSQQVHGRGGQDGSRGGQAPQVEPDSESHGATPAAWIAVGTVMAGSLLMSIAVVIASGWLFAVGAVVVVAGGIAGPALSAAGFGASGRPGHR